MTCPSMFKVLLAMVFGAMGGRDKCKEIHACKGFTSWVARVSTLIYGACHLFS